MTVKDRLYNLRKLITNVDIDLVDSELDDVFKKISSFKNFSSGSKTYIDLVKNIISKTVLNSDDVFFNEASSVSPVLKSKRIKNYMLYDSIVKMIPYAKRALNVLVDNILSPDDITKVSLQVLENNENDEDITLVNHFKQLMKKVKLEKASSGIVNDTLKYGDFFVEITTTPLQTTSIINERSYFDTMAILNESFEFNNGKINLNIRILEESVSLQQSNKNDIYLSLIEPYRVVKLQTSNYPICFGYLVFPKYIFKPDKLLDDQIVDNICRNIISKISNNFPIDQFESAEDLKEIIKPLLSKRTASGFGEISLDVRYISPERMQHFYIPSSDNFPYGQSIFFSSEFTAKVLIAIQTALTIQRLSRSTEKRKIEVELGLPRDARKAIEKLKEVFRKRKVSLDSFGTIDTIPSMITTFEDIYIPKRDGKTFVDVSSFNEGNIDTRSKVDELKFMRDIFVASLDVPPSFLGIEENLCLSLDTQIMLTNGNIMSLKEIIQEFENNRCKDIEIYSYNNKSGLVFKNKIKWAGITRRDTSLCRIWLENGEYFDCTFDHPVMLRDGTYKEAIELKKGELLMTISTICKTSESYHSGVTVYLEEDKKYENQLQLNHIVDKVEILEGTYDTGDITVEGDYHNFAITAGIFVHNSNKSALSEENILFARSIIKYQKIFSENFTELMMKVCEIDSTMDDKNLVRLKEICSIVLSPPMSLQLERENNYINNAASLIRSLEELGIPKEFTKKQYLPNIDWSSLEDFSVKEKIDKDLTKDEEESTGGSSFGGF